ncbi:MAG: hypothetical protein K2K63_13825, partial [Acetatifactor sp.]|nr:hypothetical protein [Acetatifactor sp.]
VSWARRCASETALPAARAGGAPSTDSRGDSFDSGRVLFNSLSWERSWKGLQLPSCGYVTLRAGAGDVRPQDGVQVESSDAAEGEKIVLANAFYRAEIDRIGCIIILTDSGSGYEYAKEPLNDWKLYRDVNVDYDAWELGRMYEQAAEELSGGRISRTVREPDGSLIVTVERRERYFTARQRIILTMDSPRIDFETEIDWRERHRILKVDFPTTVYTKEVLEEIQFGYIKRPTHKSRRYEQDLYETCHHKYAVLTDGENGFAVLNDCKYGLSAEDSRLSLTLLRAPVLPDMTADMGTHRFTYSILPFSGPFAASRVTEEAYELNVEVTESGGGNDRVCVESIDSGDIVCGERGCFAPEAVERSFSFFALEGGHAVLETCKPAFDRENGVVLRLYESKGCAGVTTLKLNEALDVKHACICNMLEEPEQELEIRDGRIQMNFRAFEIKTILLYIAAGGGMRG